MSGTSIPATPARSTLSLQHDEKRQNVSKKPRTSDDRLSSLKAYRRAKGLCYKCGERWGPSHKCSPTVSLNVMEEVWQFCSDSNSSNPEDSDSGEDLCAISLQAVNGTEGARTIRLRGYIHRTEVFMLVDSGSTHSFIDERAATQIPGCKDLSAPVRVRVANGSLIYCTHELPDLLWGVQGQTFKTTFKIIPLGCYDAI